MVILLAAFITLLTAAALCFGLNRALPARVLGLIATAAALAAAALCAFSPLPPAEQAPVAVFELGMIGLSFNPALAAGERALALGLLGGGSAVLLNLAGAVGASVRGFGGIFAWGLLCLSAALLSLAAPPLSLAQPLAWAVLASSAYAAVRGSGSADAGETPPPGLVSGLLASVLIAGGVLAATNATVTGELPAWPGALCGLLAVLGLTGAPPLASTRSEAAMAPAPLGALIYGLAAPAAALGWLLRAVAALPTLPTAWAITLGLVGALGALACGAGALGQRRLRPLLIWSSAGMAALVVATTGLAGPLAALAGPGLLLSLMLSTAVGAVAASILDRTTGSDDFTEPGSMPPRAAGLIWALAMAASLGLPALWGFWPRLWLLEAAQEEQPWLLAPLLAGGVLSMLALLAPLGRLWGRRGTATPARLSWADAFPATIAGLPLLVLGVAPGLTWEPWLAQLAFAPPALPIELRGQATVVGAGVTLVALGALVARAHSVRTLDADPDETAAYLGPDALGGMLKPLAWLAAPEPLFGLLWSSLVQISRAVRFVVGLFEQRYYLLGVLGALIVIMLLMAL